MTEEKSFGQEVAGAMQEGAEALSAGKPPVTREASTSDLRETLSSNSLKKPLTREVERFMVWQEGGQFPGDPSANYELADELIYTYEGALAMVDGEEQDVTLHVHLNSEGMVCDMWTKPEGDEEPVCIRSFYRSFYMRVDDLSGECH